MVFTCDFLKKFERKEVRELVKGRLLLITLRKGNAVLQVVAVYGATGEGPHP